jgi:predicted MPP superfamily phosphohydrolase
MKGFRLAVFLTIFFLLYGSLNFYIYFSAVDALRHFAPEIGEKMFFGFFCFVVFSYPIARIFGKWLPIKISDSLAFIGGLWFAAMLYLILSLVFIDLFALIFQFIPVIDAVVNKNLSLINFVLFSLVSLITISLLFYGYINAINPRIRKVEINVDKSPPGIQSLTIAFASDIHLGHVIGKKTLNRIINLINNSDPDLVLFPGDLVDEELEPVVKKNIGPAFKQLNPKYGVFAVTGNHEYIGGVDPAVEYLSKFGIRFLRDEIVNIENKFYVAGREDVSTNTFFGKPRKALSDLFSGADKNLPIITMDHQPIALSEAKDVGVDLQISGHTHHGQMWPLQAITKRVFKLSWGYKKMGDSHFYVSSGAGTWGPRIRIGNNPEVVLIKMNFAG